MKPLCPRKPALGAVDTAARRRAADAIEEPPAFETVKVFVSRTFDDMHAERDYLVKEVFPALRGWCERRRLRLIDVDLRWGVTEVDATRHWRGA